MPRPQKRRSLSRSISRSPHRSCWFRSLSRSRERNRLRARDSANASNPGNNLFVNRISRRATSENLIRHFSSVGGKVLECKVVRDPRSKESRGYAFVTMETVKDADDCIRYLNITGLLGRLMTVEKAKRRHRWSRTPGRYLSLRRGHDSRQSRSYSRHGWHKDDSYSH